MSKPFFTLSFYDGKQTYEDTFSMYDIENAPTTVSADEITIDGSASSIAEFSNYLGTKSVDGSLKVTWSLGNHSYSKTVKNVYSTSYVIPVSWLDAISDSSQAYGGGKVTVQISYGTKVYTTISATFNCIVSDTFLPTISSVTLADKTNTPVPASWNKVFVQNQSGIRVSAITCAASQGATVKRIKLRLDTQYTEQTYSASSLPQINRIINSGSLECEVTITDSRGRTCSKTATVNVLPYDIPKFTLIESDRCNKTGEMDNDGTYFLSQSAVEYSSCTGLNSITKESVENGTYKLDAYTQFKVYEPKERDIVSTRIKDRVFQRSLCDNYFYDTMTKSFIYDNCACQDGRGTEFARKRLICHLQKYYRKQGTEGWVLKADLKNFFGSTSHELAYSAVTKRVNDEWVNGEIKRIIDSFNQGDDPEVGMGLGSETTQLIQLAVLDDFDHFIKEQLHIKHYVRYNDDFIIIHEDKAYSQECLIKIDAWISSRSLKLSPKKGYQVSGFPLPVDKDWKGSHDTTA